MQWQYGICLLCAIIHEAWVFIDPKLIRFSDLSVAIVPHFTVEKLIVMKRHRIYDDTTITEKYSEHTGFILNFIARIIHMQSIHTVCYQLIRPYIRQ